MAQLRDKETSELVFEGTPLECAALADEIGAKEVLFDDVGPNFDPKATLKAHDDNVKGLEAVAKSSNESLTADDRKNASNQAKTLRDEIANAKKQKAKTTTKIERVREAREKAQR